MNNNWLPAGWSFESDLPVTKQKKSLGQDNDIVELLWRNGQVVLHSQTRKPSFNHNDSRQVVQKPKLGGSGSYGNSSNLIQNDDDDDETVSWVQYPLEVDPFEKEFCYNLFSELPPSDPKEIEQDKLLNKFGASDTDVDATHVIANSHQPTSISVSNSVVPEFPGNLVHHPPRFPFPESAAQENHDSGGSGKVLNFRGSSNGQYGGEGSGQLMQGEVRECSVMTIGSSHCGSNQVPNDPDFSNGVGTSALFAGPVKQDVHKITPQSERRKMDTLEPTVASSSGGSGGSFGRRCTQSTGVNSMKRKVRDAEESECQSEAAELESVAGNKPAQRSTSSRRSRSAEVHNLSERRRTHSRKHFCIWQARVWGRDSLAFISCFRPRLSLSLSLSLSITQKPFLSLSLSPMALTDRSSRQSLIPSFLYSSSSTVYTSHKSFALDKTMLGAAAAPARSNSGVSSPARNFVVPAPSEPGKIEMYSPAFYAACTAGGILSCGLTHMTVTPLDLVKCNMQIDPAKYKSISSGFGVLYKEQGFRGFFRGWVPTLLGYSAQGACKFGFYEFFKKYYSDLAGPENAAKYKTLIYLAGSASAEVIADIALCPFEAVKVRVQTQPGFARGLSDGLPKFVKSEGYGGLYKGLVPLWGRQIPYTMMKFASFETIVENIYKHAIPTPKNECSKTLQLGVSFAGGYVAGVFCAIVSHPADNLVSFLNNAKGATVGDAVKKLGVLGLFTRGLPLRIVMIGTLTGAQWGIYDAFKVFVGLPTTGGVAPAAASAATELAKA